MHMKEKIVHAARIHAHSHINERRKVKRAMRKAKASGMSREDRCKLYCALAGRLGQKYLRRKRRVQAGRPMNRVSGEFNALEEFAVMGDFNDDGLQYAPHSREAADLGDDQWVAAGYPGIPGAYANVAPDTFNELVGCACDSQSRVGYDQIGGCIAIPIGAQGRLFI